jgi:hypothetical protein
MAFLIHSLSLTFMSSLVSQHFQIRFKEYLEIPGKLGSNTIEKAMGNMIHFIHQILRPPALPIQRARRPKTAAPKRRRPNHV